MLSVFIGDIRTVSMDRPGKPLELNGSQKFHDVRLADSVPGSWDFMDKINDFPIRGHLNFMIHIPFFFPKRSRFDD